MNGTVKTVVLAVVIVACLGFVVLRLTRGSGGGGGVKPTPKGERDLYCAECNEHFTAVMEERAYAELVLAGVKTTNKATCPKCSKKAAVAGIQCKACQAWVPSPGMQGMNTPGMAGRPGQGAKGPTCPKCKKPLAMPKLGSQGPAAS